MGTIDGSILGSVKLVDHGPDDEKWNLVITGDGFTSTEQSAFEGYVDDFVAFLQTSDANPFSASATWAAINVYRMDVTSDQSGADHPACGSPGAGTYVATYFDATYCADGITERAVLVDDATVFAAADSEVPEWDVVIVIVNDTEYGGAAHLDSGVCAASLAAPLNETMLHELGHAGFNLQDEYCDPTKPGGPGIYTGAEPASPNATIATTLATLKWASNVPAGTSIPPPTMTNPDRTGATCDTRPSPVPASTIGLFEGAMSYAVGAYRPAYTCRMNDQYQPFCQVCVGVILNQIFVETAANPCWVATAVYADPDHPDVVTIRRWRDQRLAAGSPAMRLLVAAYSRIGPTLARTTTRHSWLSGPVRTLALHPLAVVLRGPSPSQRTLSGRQR